MLIKTILLSVLVLSVMAIIMGFSGVVLYAIIGAGWTAYLRYQGSPWLVIEGVLWPSSVYLNFFDRSE